MPGSFAWEETTPASQKSMKVHPVGFLAPSSKRYFAMIPSYSIIVFWREYQSHELGLNDGL